MKPLPHRYEVLLSGGATGYAALSAAGLPNVASAPPAEFDGPGDAWSPEQLLLAAVATCFAFTLRAVAQASRVDFTSRTDGRGGSGSARGPDVLQRDRAQASPAGACGNGARARAAGAREGREDLPRLRVSRHADPAGARGRETTLMSRLRGVAGLEPEVRRTDWTRTRQETVRAIQRVSLLGEPRADGLWSRLPLVRRVYPSAFRAS